MMKNIKNIFALLVIALVGLSLTGCSEDDLSTNQFGGGVSLKAYGPNPVMRGGMLRFVGSNLNQVTSVNIPGVGDITTIEVVKSGVPSEIRVNVPKDGPEKGFVTLKTKGGETLTTLSQLYYIEGIEINTITPNEVMAGDVIKIEGDYLNLIKSMAFADGVLVSGSAFISQSRYSLEVAVPEEARTGKLEFYTEDLTIERTAQEEDELNYQTIQSEGILTVGLPPTTKIVSPRGTAEAQGTITAKAGETITLTGTHYNVVKAVVFGSVEVEEITVSKDAKTLSFVLPAEAPGGEFALLCKSGVKVPLATLTTVKPSGCKAGPTPVKAGNKMAIEGNDMDLVSSVRFADANGEYTISTFSGDSNNSPKCYFVNVPDNAIEGNIQLVMANGEFVEVPFKLVKPVVTSYNANPVSAGAALQLTGTDLDLVKSINFGEALNEDGKLEVSADGTTLTVTVPMAGTSGKPKLNLANGTQVEAPELNINEAVFCYITELPGEDAELKAGESMTVPVANGDKLTGVQIKGEDCQFVLVNNKTQLIVGIPEKAGMGSDVKLISSNGSISYTIDFIPNTEVTTVLWTGTADLAGWSWNWEIGKGSQGDNNPTMFADMDLQEGDVIRVYLTAYNDWWQVQFFDGHWANQAEIGNATGLNNGNNINSGIYNLAEHNGAIEIPVTATLKEQLTTLTDWGMCWIMQGEGVVVTKIAVTHYVSLETVVWTGEAVADDWGNQPYILSDGGTELLAAGMKVGSVIRCYLTATDASWNCQIVDGHWSPNTPFDGCDFNSGWWNLAEHNGAIEFTVTNYIYEHITTPGGWGGSFLLNGDNVICTKVTIE